MCTVKSKSFQAECKVDELKQINIHYQIDNEHNIEQLENLKENESSIKDISPELRSNIQKFTDHKIPCIVINKQISILDGINENTENISPKCFDPFKKQQSIASDVVENEFMTSLTKATDKTPDYNLQDKRFENISYEKPRLFSMNSLREEKVGIK